MSAANNSLSRSQSSPEEPFTENPFSDEPFSEKSSSEKSLSEELFSDDLFSEEHFSEVHFSEKPFPDGFFPEEPCSDEPCSDEPCSEEPCSQEPRSEELVFEEPPPGESFTEEDYGWDADAPEDDNFDTGDPVKDFRKFATRTRVRYLLAEAALDPGTYIELREHARIAVLFERTHQFYDRIPLDALTDPKMKRRIENMYNEIKHYEVCLHELADEEARELEAKAKGKRGKKFGTEINGTGKQQGTGKRSGSDQDEEWEKLGFDDLYIDEAEKENSDNNFK